MEQIVHHADVTAFGKVLILPELPGILKFRALVLNIPIANVS